MYFLQAFSTPISVVIGDVFVEIPKFTVKDFSLWGQEVQQKMVETATAHLDDEKKTEYLSFYPVLPPTRQELRRMAATDEGMEKIIKTCLLKASYFSVKKVKKIRMIGKGVADLVTGKQPKIKEEYEVEDKGTPAEKKGEAWIDELISNNTGRIGHLAVVLADMNDTSMNVPASIAKRESDEQKKEEGDNDPLSTGGTEGETQ